MNEQPIEKRNIRSDGVLEIVSVFYTIQGEGPFSGRPCVFVRLAGCNLQCPGCDTEYTSGRRWVDPLALTHLVEEQFGDKGDGRKFVVITGGEPFRQHLVPFLKCLRGAGMYVQIETNGTLAPPIHDIKFETDITQSRGVYIVVSPKSGKVHQSYHSIACAFKYVLSHESVDPEDGLPVTVLDHTVGGKVARPEAPFMGEIYINPMDHAELEGPMAALIQNRLSLEAAKISCLEHGYTLGLQLHKIIGVD